MSIENGTTFARANLIRAPLGWTLKMSPATGAPLTSTSSRPPSPLATSLPSPLFHTIVSSPAPPFIASLPRAPTRRSSPPPPLSTSLPSPPRMRSGPSEPSTVSAPAPPSTDSSVSAPTPSLATTESSPPRPLTWKRSVDTSSVNALRFVRWNLMRPAFASRLKMSPEVGAPLTSVPSLPASPLRVSEPSPLFHTSVSLPAPPFMTSAPPPPTRRSLPSPPVSVSLLASPLSTSSPPSPLSPGAGELAFVREHRDRVVAAAAVDDHGARAVGRHRLDTVVRTVPVRLAIEAARRLIVHEHPAKRRHRHDHVVISAIEVERRGQIVDRRRTDRR